MSPEFNLFYFQTRSRKKERIRKEKARDREEKTREEKQCKQLQTCGTRTNCYSQVEPGQIVINM